MNIRQPWVDHYEWTDSVADWAESHPITTRAHRAIPLEEPHYTAPQGRPEQGWPVRRCSPEMACWDATQDDQSESADGDVLLWLLKGACVVSFVLFCAWVIAGGLNA